MQTRQKIFTEAILIFCFILFFYEGSFGQNSIISILNNRTIYWEYDNIIEIAMPKNPQANIFIKANHSEVSKVSDYRFIIHPNPPQEETVTIYQITGKDTVLIDSANFIVKGIPDPVVRLEKHAHFNKTIFWYNKLIAYSNDNVETSFKYEVCSFTVRLMRENAIVDSLNISGNILNESFIKLGEKSKPGDKVWFDDIMIIFPNGRLKWVQPVHYNHIE